MPELNFLVLKWLLLNMYCDSDTNTTMLQTHFTVYKVRMEMRHDADM